MSAVFGRMTDRSLFSGIDDEQMPLLGAAVGESAGLTDQQFRLFNMLPDGGLADPHLTTPSLEGSDDAPDVRMTVQLVTFNAGDLSANETRATLRLDVGQSPSSSTRHNPLFWSIAAGLDLVDLVAAKKAGRRLEANFDNDFSHRPIDIAGGLAELRFEVVCHSEPPWWKQIFGFLQTGSGSSLIAACGFPGITKEAVKIVDRAFDQLSGSQRPLFESQSMTFALTAKARDNFVMGVQGVQLGCINKGFCVLAPQIWYQELKKLRPKFLVTYGALIPASMKIEDYLSNPVDNPFTKMPYAVLRISSKSISIG